MKTRREREREKRGKNLSPDHWTWRNSSEGWRGTRPGDSKEGEGEETDGERNICKRREKEGGQ